MSAKTKDSKSEHDTEVAKFFRECQKKDPQKFEEVMGKYPVLSFKRVQVIREREAPLSIIEEGE